MAKSRVSIATTNLLSPSVPTLLGEMGNCWHAFVRWVGNRTDEPQRTRYRTEAVESIKFENLLTVEKREKENKKALVTDTELQHVREGRLDRLEEEQRKEDREKEAQLRREEEALRREEEAYYAAKREAARRVKQAKQSSSRSQPLKLQSGTSQTVPIGSAAVTSSTAPSFKLKPQEEEEEDFDRFLENIKAKQNALSATRVTITSDSEEELEEEEEVEVDFGYWEKASSGADGMRGGSTLKEVDLDLL